VAALEEFAGKFANRVTAPEWDAEQIARFQEEFEAAAKEFPLHQMRLLPSPPPLTPDQVRQLLRESVTVVQPGEVLFFTVGDPDMRPTQIRAIQDVINWWLADNAPDVKVLVLPHGEMGVAEPMVGANDS
jgi:hypothetical protein